jgi:hypothetical protein
MVTPRSRSLSRYATPRPPNLPLRITASSRSAWATVSWKFGVANSKGTHSGPWGGQPAAGRRARFSGVDIFRFQDGNVAEIRNHRDDLGLMQQLGVPIFAGATPD